MPRARKLVLLVHGVSPDRRWQTRAARVLEPHFECIPITYRHYASPIGAFVVFVNVSIFVLLAVGFYLLPWLRSWTFGITAFAMACVASVILARARRHWVVDHVKAQISKKTGGRTAHVIAHSFGTYICGWALAKFHDLRFERVVLVGSVLPIGFNWRNVRRRKPPPFQDIRNEVGMTDCVVWLVTWMQAIASDLGVAGLRGFAGERRHVHQSWKPWGPCRICAITQREPLIHNVFLASYRHSTWALGPGHARTLWLPYLWKYSPREFDEFVECCRDAAYSRQEQFWQDLDDAEERLRDRAWPWTRGRSVEEFLAAEIDSRASRPETAHPDILRDNRATIIAEAFENVYVNVADAYEEIMAGEMEPPPTRDDNAAIVFYPPFAIARALEVAVKNAIDKRAQA
jgi:pimeloyl-ACP methyl ester carboxylesterase